MKKLWIFEKPPISPAAAGVEVETTNEGVGCDVFIACILIWVNHLLRDGQYNLCRNVLLSCYKFNNQ